MVLDEYRINTINCLIIYSSDLDSTMRKKRDLCHRHEFLNPVLEYYLKQTFYDLNYNYVNNLAYFIQLISRISKQGIRSSGESYKIFIYYPFILLFNYRKKMCCDGVKISSFFATYKNNTGNKTVEMGGGGTFHVTMYRKSLGIARSYVRLTNT